jgi:hypothetical protein
MPGSGELTGSVQVEHLGYPILLGNVVEGLKAAITGFLRFKETIAGFTGGVIGSKDQGNSMFVGAQPAMRAAIQKQHFTATGAPQTMTPMMMIALWLSTLAVLNQPAPDGLG